MKNSTRFFTFLLCLVMLASCGLTACNDDAETSSTPTGTSGNAQVETGFDGTKYVVKMPEFTWSEKKEVVVCITSDTTQSTYFSEDIDPDLYATTEDRIKEALRRRNDEIEETYGVKVVAEPVDDVKAAVKLDSDTGTHLYDFAMPFMTGAATLASENYLYDLNSFSDYLHLDQAWWDQSANKALSINNQLYFTTGDISIMPKIVSIAMTFNKEMLKKNFPDVNLYEMVENKEWTFDKLIEMSRAVTVESDGVTGMTYSDTWGLSSSYGDASMLYLSSGKSYIQKDDKDLPVLTLNQPASVTMAQNILENLQLKDEWCYHCDQLPASERWVVSLDIFGQNRALFRTSAFSAIKKLRAYSDAEEFGLIPMPLMSEDQDTYYTPCNAAYAYCVAIPTSLSEDEAKFSAFMIEVLAVGAKNNLTPAYYESTLKQRDLKDDESEVMLDNYIFSNIVYDLGIVYGFGGINSMLSGLMGQNSADIASTLDSSLSAIELAIDDLLEAYGA